MDLNLNLLSKSIENKTIFWVENKNQYLVLENQTAAILVELSKGKSIEEIATITSNNLKIPKEDAENFISKLSDDVFGFNKDESILKDKDEPGITQPKEYEFINYYKINNLIFKIEFNSELELSYVHPKFAHLVIEKPAKTDHTFSVFIKKKLIYFYVNNLFIGSWNSKEIHFFQGKFSMELIQKIHQKKENEWMGVFHASAVSNDKKSILFLGDSGNGKSTSLALLQANGFTCLADDFVPIDIKNKEVYSFPAAISIKKTSLPVLLPLYPELETSAEYNFTRLNKIVRYLKPNNDNFFNHLPCKDLVFIKYEKGSKTICTKISKLKAFQELVPDSWLSPKKENAAIFLNWFETLQCYQVIYSNNEEMITCVSKIFNNEL